MSKIAYTRCDICGGVVEDHKSCSPSKIYNFKFRLINRKNHLDICDICIGKIKYLEKEVKTEDEMYDEIFNSYEYEQFKGRPDETSAFLQGAEKATKFLANNRL